MFSISYSLNRLEAIANAYANAHSPVAEINAVSLLTSVRAFEEKCGLGRGNISNMSRNGAIGSDNLTKIIDTFSDVDINWILCGRAQKIEVSSNNGNSTDISLMERVIQQAEEIGQLKERIRHLEQKLGKTAGDVSIGATANVG